MFITILFILGFLGGNLLRVTLGDGIAIGLYDVAVGAVIIFSIFSGWKRRIYPTLTFPIAIFFLVCLASLILNSTRFTFLQLGLSSLYLVRLTLYALLYFAVVKGKTDGYIWLYRLWISLVGIAGLGFVQYFLYPDLRNLYYLGWDPHYYRIVSTILDPNFCGVLFALGVFLSLYLYRSKKLKMFLAGGGILFLALLFTYSRASYLAFFVGLIVWFFGQEKRMLFGGILIALLGFILFLPRPGGEGVKLERMASVVARVGNMTDALKVFRASPIFGVGFNTLRYIKLTDEDTGIESHAVSGFDMSILFILSTTGVVGLISYGYILFSLLKIMRNSEKSYSDMSRLIAVSILMIGVHGFSVNTYFYPLVLICLAVLVGAYEKKEIR
ncbi:O-antigen ligase family protein, partial [Candidatus Gottesmanbacteria bacterium]|nr:O-antigen ligase family protein [Candidatus Gottesmanbacteria bacterium]